MRSLHFTPAYLQKSERRTIFGLKYRQMLKDNPQTATVGDEDIPLQWIDRRNDIPNRTKLLGRTIDLMAQGEGKDWQNLPALMTGLKGSKAVPDEQTMSMIVRKAVRAGRVGVIVQCLQQSEHTGVTLKREEVLEKVIWGLHDVAQMNDWSEEAVQKALKSAKQVSLMLEMEEHGGGRFMRKRDPRTRPEVVGVFLELAAVYAYKHQDGKDVDGSVSVYAERLMGCIGGQAQVRSISAFAILMV